MADFNFSDGMKKVFLAGVGAIALSAEKGSELIGELVKKGELTVEQGKDLNKDLQRSFKESMDKRGVNIDELSQKFSKMSSDELAKIKEQIAKAEAIITEKMTKADEAVEELADAAEEKIEEVKEAVEGAEEKVEEGNEAVEGTAEEAAEEAKAVAEEVEEAVAEEKIEE